MTKVFFNEGHSWLFYGVANPEEEDISVMLTKDHVQALDSDRRAWVACKTEEEEIYEGERVKLRFEAKELDGSYGFERKEDEILAFQDDEWKEMKSSPSGFFLVENFYKYTGERYKGGMRAKAFHQTIENLSEKVDDPYLTFKKQGEFLYVENTQLGKGNSRGNEEEKFPKSYLTRISEAFAQFDSNKPGVGVEGFLGPRINIYFEEESPLGLEIDEPGQHIRYLLAPSEWE